MSENKTKRKIIAIDFDGVIHSYDSPWVDYDVIPDPPVPGAIEFLDRLIRADRFHVAIFSSRNVPTLYLGNTHDPNYDPACGIRAMRKWLIANGLAPELAAQIRFPRHKPPAHVIIDDRAIRFEGTFPTLDDLESFVPWNKKVDTHEE